MKKKSSSQNPGLFGKCKAFVLSVEEQGRKSLHMHILIWIDSASNATSCVYNGTKKRKRDKREVSYVNKLTESAHANQ